MKVKLGNEHMRILLISPEYPPNGSGIAYVAKNLFKEFRKRNYNIHVCSPSGPHIKINLHYQKYGLASLILFWQKIACYLKKEGNSYDLIWMHNPIFIKTIPLDQKFLITVHSTYSGFYSAITRKFYPIKPWLKMYYFVASKLLQISYFRMRRMDAMYTCVSSTVKEEILSLGISNENIFLVPNGVDSAFFLRDEDLKLKTSLDINHDDIVFLFVGRFHPSKNIIFLLHVFSHIVRQYSNSKLIIIGEGNLKIYQFIDSSILKQRIIIIKRMSQRMLKKFYSISDYFILTSIYEGEPLVLLEALSSGLIPIISGLDNFIPIIRNLGIGKVISIKDRPKKVANEILKYIKGIKDIEIYRLLIRSYIQKNYDWRIICDEYERCVLQIKNIIRK